MNTVCMILIFLDFNYLLKILAFFLGGGWGVGWSCIDLVLSPSTVVWWAVECLMIQKSFPLAVPWRSLRRVGRFMYHFVGAREELPLIGHAGSGMTAGKSLPWQPVLTWFSRRSSRLLHTVCLITPLQGSGKIFESGIYFFSWGLNQSCFNSLKPNWLFMFTLPLLVYMTYTCTVTANLWYLSNLGNKTLAVLNCFKFYCCTGTSLLAFITCSHWYKNNINCWWMAFIGFQSADTIIISSHLNFGVHITIKYLLSENKPLIYPISVICLQLTSQR